MRKIPVSVSELKRLYVAEGWPLWKIAELYGVTKQGIHYRLKAAGVPLRQRGYVDPKFDRALLERLYHEEGLTIAAIAARLGVSFGKVATAFRRHGIERRTRSIKYPALNDLKVGESILIHHTRRTGSWHSNFHDLAARLGFRVSVRKIDGETVQVTRVA